MSAAVSVTGVGSGWFAAISVTTAGSSSVSGSVPGSVDGTNSLTSPLTHTFAPTAAMAAGGVAAGEDEHAVGRVRIAVRAVGHLHEEAARAAGGDASCHDAGDGDLVPFIGEVCPVPCTRGDRRRSACTGLWLGAGADAARERPRRAVARMWAPRGEVGALLFGVRAAGTVAQTPPWCWSGPAPRQRFDVGRGAVAHEVDDVRARSRS